MSCSFVEVSLVLEPGFSWSHNMSWEAHSHFIFLEEYVKNWYYLLIKYSVKFSSGFFCLAFCY
jgi:hypothetical protein